jgi:hypothetical protein
MDTKIPYLPGSGTADKVAESVKLSVEALGVSKVRFMAFFGELEGGIEERRVW